MTCPVMTLRCPISADYKQWKDTLKKYRVWIIFDQDVDRIGRDGLTITR